MPITRPQRFNVAVSTGVQTQRINLGGSYQWAIVQLIDDRTLDTFGSGVDRVVSVGYASRSPSIRNECASAQFEVDGTAVQDPLTDRLFILRDSDNQTRGARVTAWDGTGFDIEFLFRDEGTPQAFSVIQGAFRLFILAGNSPGYVIANTAPPDPDTRLGASPVTLSLSAAGFTGPNLVSLWTSRLRFTGFGSSEGQLSHGMLASDGSQTCVALRQNASAIANAYYSDATMAEIGLTFTYPFWSSVGTLSTAEAVLGAINTANIGEETTVQGLVIDIGDSAFSLETFTSPGAAAIARTGLGFDPGLLLAIHSTRTQLDNGKDSADPTGGEAGGGAMFGVATPDGAWSSSTGFQPAGTSLVPGYVDSYSDLRLAGFGAQQSRVNGLTFGTDRFDATETEAGSSGQYRSWLLIETAPDAIEAGATSPTLGQIQATAAGATPAVIATVPDVDLAPIEATMAGASENLISAGATSPTLPVYVATAAGASVPSGNVSAGATSPTLAGIVATQAGGLNPENAVTAVAGTFIAPSDSRTVTLSPDDGNTLKTWPAPIGPGENQPRYVDLTPVMPAGARVTAGTVQFIQATVNSTGAAADRGGFTIEGAEYAEDGYLLVRVSGTADDRAYMVVTTVTCSDGTVSERYLTLVGNDRGRP